MILFADARQPPSGAAQVWIRFGRDGNGMATLSLQGVRKSFGGAEVVHPIDLEIADREFVVLVGPSGCGKSTILRMIAGLEDATAGDILIDGEVVNDREPKDRDIAMVFQDYALYPHMTVYDNLGFGLRYRGVRARRSAARVEDAARVLDIAPLLGRMPRELSGGQRQRVAMGRAIVRDPRVFLFDEPLSNLDARLRAQMRTELKKLRARVVDHHGVRHARSGRGDDACGSHRGAEPRADRAGGHARGDLRAAGIGVRGRVSRCAADEPAARAARGRTHLARTNCGSGTAGCGRSETEMLCGIRAEDLALGTEDRAIRCCTAP